MKRVFAIFGAALLFSGCFSSRPSNRYILENLDNEVKVDATLRRIEIVGYLEHSDVMRRIGKNRVEPIPGEMWSGSFRRMLESALKEGMTPGSKRSIALKVLRFEAADDGKFHVIVDCIEKEQRRRISFELPCDCMNAENVMDTYPVAINELLKRL